MSSSHARTRKRGKAAIRVIAHFSACGNATTGDRGVAISVLRLQSEKGAEGQYVQARSLEAVDGFDGGANDRLILVETGVQHKRNSGLTLEGLNQVVIQRILLPGNSLQAPGAVHMIDGT